MSNYTTRHRSLESADKCFDWDCQRSCAYYAGPVHSIKHKAQSVKHQSVSVRLLVRLSVPQQSSSSAAAATRLMGKAGTLLAGCCLSVAVEKPGPRPACVSANGLVVIMIVLFLKRMRCIWWQYCGGGVLANCIMSLRSLVSLPENQRYDAAVYIIVVIIGLLYTLCWCDDLCYWNIAVPYTF